MPEFNYHLDTFEGPLDLLLSLIQKNKFNIEDIPISIICDQYFDYIKQAQNLDMEIASEFIVMASELMLIKSKMLLPKPEDDKEDPRASLADALLKYNQAKCAAKQMALLYPIYSARYEKDTQEISIDKSFVAPQQAESLRLAVRRILSYNENNVKNEKSVFTPMISNPIVAVESKISGIIGTIKSNKSSSLRTILKSSSSLPDMIAMFLGVLELVKIQRILIVEDTLTPSCVFDYDTLFVINENYVNQEL